MLKRYLIEPDIPGVGAMSGEELGVAARTSKGTLRQIDGIQWVHSYVTRDKTYCIYLAESEELIHARARNSGLAANRVTKVKCIIDPATEQNCTDAIAAVAT